jgi:hypothetical protein
MDAHGKSRSFEKGFSGLQNNKGRGSADGFPAGQRPILKTYVSSERAGASQNSENRTEKGNSKIRNPQFEIDRPISRP